MPHDFFRLDLNLSHCWHLSFTGYICFAIKEVFIYTTLINLRSLEELGRAWKSLESFALSLRVRSVFTKLRQAPSLWFWVQPSTGHFWFRLWHPEKDLKQVANWNGDSLWKSEKCNCFNSEKHLHWVLLLKHCRCLILSIATKRNSLPRATHYWYLLTFIDIYWHLLTYFKYFHYSQSRGPSFLQHRMQHPHRLTSRQGFFPGWKSEALTLRFTWSWRNQESSKMFKALASVAPEVAKQLPSQTRFVLLFHLAHQSLSGWSSEETTLTWKLKTSKTHYDQIWLIWSVIISVGSRRWPFLPTASPSGSTFLKSDCTHPLTASWLRCNLGPDTT